MYGQMDVVSHVPAGGGIMKIHTESCGVAKETNGVEPGIELDHAISFSWPSGDCDRGLMCSA